MTVRPGYKQTEVGVIPEDWGVDHLGNISSISSGTTPFRELRERYYSNGTINWVKTLDLNNREIVETDERVTEIALKETSLKIYDVDTVLVAMYGGFNQIGRTGILKIPAAVNQAISAIRVDSKKLNPTFLLNFFNYQVGYWKNVAISSRKDPNITSADVKNFPIVLPPLREQQAIAEALSDVDGLISALDALIAKKRALKGGAMQELLTGQRRLPGFVGEWTTYKIGDIFQFLNTANNSRSDLSDYGEVKYIHYGDIHTNPVSFLDCANDYLPSISKDKVANIPCLEDGDLVMADASEDYAGTGKSIEVRNTTGRQVVAGLHTLLLRGNKSILADGFKGYLQQIPSVKTSLIKIATGISVYGISKNNLKNIEISLPSTPEQTAIAQILADMDAELAALAQKRAKTVALKQGMMQALLTGQVRLG